MDKIKRTVFEVIGFALLIFLDQYTKGLAVSYLKDKEPFEVINGVLELYYLPNGNKGAAFGMLEGHIFLFMLIALIVVAIIGYILFNMPFDRKYNVVNVLLVFIAAGGIGNMIDRMLNGYVVDFIYFSLINFPIFNVADMYVTVSTVILALLVLFYYKEDDFKKMESSVKAPFKKKNEGI